MASPPLQRYFRNRVYTRNARAEIAAMPTRCDRDGLMLCPQGTTTSDESKTGGFLRGFSPSWRLLPAPSWVLG